MKRRDNLGWSQSDLARELQLAGWDIDRNAVSKIECRLTHIRDYQLLFFERVLNIEMRALYPPRINPPKRIDNFLDVAMERKRLPIRRGREKGKQRGKK
jgi:transcriptional regulator with XRE-family HTH domain